MLVFFMSSNSFGWLFFFFFVSTIAFIFMFSRVHRVVFVDKTSGGEDDRGAEASAAGARIEAPKAPRGVGRGEGVSGRGLCPLPQKFFDFGSQNGEFWCILGVLVTVLLLLSFTHKPSVIWPLPIFFCNVSLWTLFIFFHFGVGLLHFHSTAGV